MIYNRREALRYMGAQAEDPGAENLCDLVYMKLRNEVQARHLIRKMPCSVDVEGVRVGQEYFCSHSLARHLQGCEELLLFAATLGTKVDVAVRRLSLTSIAEGNAAQAVAASLIEVYCNQTLAAYDSDGLEQLSRFSPGYGDWALGEQTKFFRLLDCTKIGLTLTEGGMMAPLKSVTAVVGLRQPSSGSIEPGNDNQHARGENRCGQCGLTACQFRTNG